MGTNGDEWHPPGGVPHLLIHGQPHGQAHGKPGQAGRVAATACSGLRLPLSWLAYQEKT